MDFDQSVPRLLLKDQNKKNHKGKRKSNTTSKNNSLKVVYISSPMKVKTSASLFSSLVQELTGKNSDISRYTDGEFNYPVGENFSGTHFLGRNGPPIKEPNRGCRELPLPVSPDETPTSSDSFLGTPTMDTVLVARMKDQFEEIFATGEFDYYDPTRVDVLGEF